MEVWQDAGAGFPVREQAITLEDQPGTAPWRRIELVLDAPTEDGDTTIRLWSNLPSEIGAERIAALNRTRRRIEARFGRLESVLNSELAGLGHPRAALLGFTVAVLVYNVRALLARCMEPAHQQHEPPLDVSTFHLARLVTGSYKGMLIAVPLECWPLPDVAPAHLAERLLSLARHINPRAVATSRRKPKPVTPKGDVDARTSRPQVATARALAHVKARP